jgi:DDE superfamily endonuclease
MWCIPKVSPEFVVCMEDILDVYEIPYDPLYPTVCFDEMPKQLIAETRPTLPTRPGQVKRCDYEYQRKGVRNLWMFFEPLAGQRHTRITLRRTKRDFALLIRWLVDEVYPDAVLIRLVLDNLNTHVLSALYETFEPAEANRIRKRLELHYTPKHGSWLNMAEIEFSVFSRQACAGYIPDEETLQRQVTALEQERNALGKTANWRFTSQNARVKLHRLYPSPSN